MDLVIDDQAPFALVEQLEVLKPALLVCTPSEDVVGGDGDRSNVLGLPGVFSDCLTGQCGFVDQLSNPLTSRCDAGRQYNSRGLQEGHARQADDGFTGTAGQHNDRGSAARGSRGVERLGSFPLITPKAERQPSSRLGAQSHIKSLALDVASQVFDGVADFDQRLLEPASLGRINKELPRSDTPGEQRGHSLMASQFLGERRFRNAKQETPVIPRQLQFSVAPGVVGNLDFDVTRHIVLGEPAQLVADPFGGHAGGTRVPDRERRDSIGVNMLGRLHKLCEAGQCIPSLDVGRTIHFDQNRKVTLHDERIFVLCGGHSFFLPT